MTPTITEYQPGIYAEMNRRAEERREREERNIRLIDLAADVVLGFLVLVWIAWVLWMVIPETGERKPESSDLRAASSLSGLRSPLSPLE
jgi:hypothetical protein